MNKIRDPQANWYTEPFSRRMEMMTEHGIAWLAIVSWVLTACGVVWLAQRRVFELHRTLGVGSLQEEISANVDLPAATASGAR